MVNYIFLFKATIVNFWILLNIIDSTCQIAKLVYLSFSILGYDSTTKQKSFYINLFSGASFSWHNTINFR